MHIQHEPHMLHSIQAYDANQVRINGVNYTRSLLANNTHINAEWPVYSRADFNAQCLDDILSMQPEIILIGAKFMLPCEWLAMSAQKGVGIECMQIGAACRTFNILLGEHRSVVLGLILEPV